MLGRIEFTSRKFQVNRPRKKGAQGRPNLTCWYNWLSNEMTKTGLKHKVIDMDKGRKKSAFRLGKTMLVEHDSRYQLVWGWLPDLNDVSAKRGVWFLDIFKKRTTLDVMLWRNRLTAKDAVVATIVGYLDSDEFSDVTFLNERQVKIKSKAYRAD